MSHSGALLVALLGLTLLWLPWLPACCASGAPSISSPVTDVGPVSQRDVLNIATTTDERASFSGKAQDKNMNRDIEDCKDLHVKCDHFADDGICDSHPGMMAIYCPVGMSFVDAAC